jgi:hypothetical protein
MKSTKHKVTFYNGYSYRTNSIFLICNYDKNKREKDIPFIFLKNKTSNLRCRCIIYASMHTLINSHSFAVLMWSCGFMINIY